MKVTAGGKPVGTIQDTQAGTNTKLCTGHGNYLNYKSGTNKSYGLENTKGE